jgi:signal peptidase II
MRKKKVGRNKIFYPVAFFSILADQFSKYWMCNLLHEELSLNIFRYFSLTLVRNTGICFGMFNTVNVTIPIIIASVVIAVIISLYFYKFAGNSRLMAVALGLIEGGIIGNLIDRITIGAVIDFIDFHVWPVFNLADVCIVSGIGLIFLKQIKKHD